MYKKMLAITLALAGLAYADTAPISNASMAQSNFTEQQKQEIAAIVANTLINNPGILVEAVDKLHQQQATAMQQQAISNILQNSNTLLNNAISPFVGSSDAKVVVIEFMDYQCVYCHQDYPVIKSLMSTHPEVKFVFKEFPIFGDVSKYAAEMALAAAAQGKFEAYHNALFATGLMEGQLKTSDVDQVARQVGMDLNVAKTFMTQASVSAELSTNQTLATSMGMQGTPDFIVMPNSVTANPAKITFLPGAVSSQVIEQAITQAES